MKMNATSFLGSVSAGIIPPRLKASSAVVPLPISSLSLKLEDRDDHCNQKNLSDLYTWCLRALNASTDEQQRTLESLLNDVVYQDSDRESVDVYLDFNVRMLDDCNKISEKIELIQNYIASLRLVTRLLESNGGDQPHHRTTLARAKDALDSCLAIERSCNEMDQKSGSSSSAGLKKLFSFQMKPRHHHHHCHQDSRLREILSGSKGATTMATGILHKALSFKSRRALSSKMQELDSVSELQNTASLAKRLKEQIIMKERKKNDIKFENVEELKMKCEELENRIKPLEGKVKELYKKLISVRMALLGILSHSRL